MLRTDQKNRYSGIFLHLYFFRIGIFLERCRVLPVVHFSTSTSLPTLPSLFAGRAGHHRGQPRGYDSDHRILRLSAPNLPDETATPLAASFGGRGNKAEDFPDRKRARRQNTAGGGTARSAEGGSSFHDCYQRRWWYRRRRRPRTWCWEIGCARGAGK